jgi:hypothetical protein
VSRRPTVDLDDRAGSPWRMCVDCERVPAGGFFVFETDCVPEEGPFR